MTSSWNKKLTAVLIVLVLVVAGLSGCLGRKKQNEKPGFTNYTEFEEDLIIALNAYAETKFVHMNSSHALFSGNFEEAEELAKETKKLHETSLNHLLSALNKTNDPTLREFIENLIEANRYYIKAEDAWIERIKFDSQDDFQNSKKIGEIASGYYIKAGQFEDKALEIWDNLLSKQKQDYQNI